MSNKISIITAIYNAEKYLEPFFDNMLLQKGDYELIIIDGNSTDRTLKIVEKYRNHITYFISERDKGIYDAWNKGVAQAKGDWIMFLGADDKLYPNALNAYLEFIKTNNLTSENCLYISSKMQIVDEKGANIRIKGWPWQWPFFLKEMTVAHPGSLHSTELFKKFGKFDISYKSSGDYELLLRPKHKLNAVFFDKVTVIMQEGGMSDSLLGVREHRRAAINTGGAYATSAYINSWYVMSKFYAKKIARSLGLNLYLKK